jgi:hypothetical protein
MKQGEMISNLNEGVQQPTRRSRTRTGSGILLVTEIAVANADSACERAMTWRAGAELEARGGRNAKTMLS